MELTSVLSEGIVTLYIYMLFEIVGNSAYDKNWNSCPLPSDALRLLPRVSLKECRHQCNIRHHCKLICYRTATKLCEIHGQDPPIKACKRCVSIVQEKIHTEQSGIPVSCAGCSDGQTCNTTTGVCEYTECPELLFTSGKTYGNLAYVGAKKLRQCFVPSNIYTTTTCTDSGEWNNLPPCEHICPSTEGILTVADEFHVIFCNLAVTQQVAHRHCSAMGGELIKMDEPYKIQSLLQTINTINGLEHHDYWVDGYSENGIDYAGWKFSDETQMPMEKIFWAGHAPNGIGPNCVRLSRGSGHLLDDKECNSLYHYACKMH